MAFFPPPGSQIGPVYPSPGPAYLAPQPSRPVTPSVVYIPSSRAGSHRSHRHHDDYDSDGDHDHHRRHRSHKRSRRRRGHSSRHTQVITVPPPGHFPGGAPVSVLPSVTSNYPSSYHYVPSWTQRLRQFFGFAPTSPQYKYQSNTHSWGFLGQSRRPRYINAYTGAEVDKYGRPVIRI